MTEPDEDFLEETPGQNLDPKTFLAIQLWLKWKNSREAQLAIPKKLIVEVLCHLWPAQELNIRSGTSKFEEAQPEENPQP